MMGHHEPLKGGDEQDVLTRIRSEYKYTKKSGVCRAAKKKFNRRVRKLAKSSLEKDT